MAETKDTGGAAGTTKGDGATTQVPPPPTDAASNADMANKRRASARKAAASATDQQTDPSDADPSQPTGDGSFGHSVNGAVPLSPQPPDATGAAAPAAADVNTVSDLTGTPEDQNAVPRPAPSPVEHPAYDIQKVYSTANQSVQQDEQGRWKIKFPQGVDMTGMDQHAYQINPDTTFATRELAYRAAAELLKTSTSMRYVRAA